MPADSVETGVVKEVFPDGRATVLFCRDSACGGCDARGVCMTLGGVSGRELLVDAVNEARARAGDVVRLDMSEAVVLPAAMILYLMPMITAIFGCLAGWRLGVFLGENETPISILGFLFGLGIGMALAKWRGKKIEGSEEFTPRIVEVLPKVTSRD